MQLSKIQNPFKQFMKSCGHDVSHVPDSSMDTLFGMSDFFEWSEDQHNNLPILHVISLDGFASDVIFNTWQENAFDQILIPAFIADNPNAIVLFENSAEGHCDKDIFEFIHQVTRHYALSNVFYGNSCVNISDIFKTFAYDTYDVLYTRNYKEDTMLQLDISSNYEFNNNKKYLFNCLNNAPRPHRTLLLGAMLNKNLHNNILSSPDVPFEEVVTNAIQYFTNMDDIKTCTTYLEKLHDVYPLVYDDRDADVVHMKSVGDTEGLFDCDIQIITESSIGKELFFTEKVFKPILMKQPFIIFGPHRIYQHLNEMGYKTYNHLFDNIELYDGETNVLQKIDILIDNLEVLSIKKDNSAIWDNIISLNKEIAEHNFDVFHKNAEFILNNIRVDLDSWLKVYPEFDKIFQKG
jgi:hypothetical protein